MACHEQATGSIYRLNDNWHTPGFWPVFCASLADVFDNEVPDEWRRDLFDLIARTPYLTWLLLTKRIGNVARMLPPITDLPGNIWIGATIVNQAEADRDILKLLMTPATKRFVSYEPALEEVDFLPWLDPTGACCMKEMAPCLDCPAAEERLHGNQLDWIIVGGESDQPGMPPARVFDLAWARSVVAQCRAAGVAPFVKQLGSNCGWDGIGGPPPGELKDHMGIVAPGLKWRVCMNDRHGANPAEWPEDLRVREFPT
jgi:protein gp37